MILRFTKSTFLRKTAGMTFVELIVAASIFMMILSVVVVQSRNSRIASNKLTQTLSFQMEVRKVTDKLSETLNNATEIVKPLEGSSLSFLVVKNLRNHLQTLFLEKATQKSDEPFLLMSYIDEFTGPKPENKKKITANVKSITFTNSSPGMVVVHLVMLDKNGQELSSITEIPLSNFSSIDEMN